MPSNTAASMYGGAGGRGSRASVTTLDGLRNVLRNETERDSAPAPAAAPVTQAAPPAPPAPVAPADDKQTLRGLNKRLQDYLGKVNELQAENDDLEKQIDDILAKREKPEGRDWDEVQKPLDELREKIKDIAMDSAKLLLENDNTKMANDDLKNKLQDEKNARTALERELEDLNKVMEDTKLTQENMKKEIELVKDEIDRLEKEHKDMVDDLCDKIKESKVEVELVSQNSNLSEIISKIRKQYEKLGEKNRKEAEEWYQSKFDNIKEADAQNIEATNYGKTELKEKLKEKQTLEIMITSMHRTIQNLEVNLKNTKLEYDQQLFPINQTIMNLEAELKRVRSQVEHQVHINNELVSVKMKLEAELRKYDDLMKSIMPEIR
ncbi:keratin, type I cytoskeletal 18-like isoform X2 [Anabas testudineus]|uniref:IF rod domain-containing protein n=1 Tax=Anabas testudineus TaxID=64144 RepID=A0AAQ6IEI5_ANATE|nr:keratin, type I cytoskeletal 18-like isoform X2 [Anabas testudineus]